MTHVKFKVKTYSYNYSVFETYNLNPFKSFSLIFIIIRLFTAPLLLLHFIAKVILDIPLIGNILGIFCVPILYVTLPFVWLYLESSYYKKIT